MNAISIRSIFKAPKPPTPQQRALQELHDAEHALLVALSEREHATATVSYNECRVKRLKAYVTTEIA